MTSTPKALILHATGTNRDQDVSHAFEKAGARPEIVHLNQLRSKEKRWIDYQILVLPGGFSYADALGAGKLLALDLITYFTTEIKEFIQTGKPVIGICNGYQALVKSGLLPGSPKITNPIHHPKTPPTLTTTLTFNDRGHFECRWVYLKAASTHCVWTASLPSMVYCPVAHGEGQLIVSDLASLAELQSHQQVALIYAKPDGTAANGAYPHNPNGSIADIAGLCNPSGNILGLMPHPENHIFPYQHPRWSRGESAYSGLPLFNNGVAYAAQM